MVMATKTPQGARLNPQNTLELSQGMSIQTAIDTADAHGGNWTILLYPGTIYDEGDLTPSGGANITLKCMGEGRVLIAPVAAPTTAVIVSGFTLNLEDIDVTAPTDAFPAVRVTGGTFEVTGSIIQGNGVGDAVQQVAGTAMLHDTQVPVGDIDLRDAACTLVITDCIVDGTLDTANGAGANVVMTITVRHCDFNDQAINLAATGACVYEFVSCNHIGTITDASLGAGAVNGHLCRCHVGGTLVKNGTTGWLVDNSELAAVSNTDATGGISLYGGLVLSYIRAVGSIVWWLDGNTLKVIPCTTTTDTIIGHAVTAAGAGDTILIHPGTYEEAITCAAGIDLKGVGPASSVIIYQLNADIITLADNVHIDNLTVRLGTPDAERHLIEDNAVACTARLTNLIMEIVTPTNVANLMVFYFTGAGDYTIERCSFSITYTGAAVAHGVHTSTNAATLHLVNNDFTYLVNTAAIHIFSAIGSTITGGGNRWAGTGHLFGVTLGTITLDNEAVVCTGMVLGDVAIGAAVTLRTGDDSYEVFPGMQIQHAVAANRYIFLHPGAFTLTASLDINVGYLTIQGSGRATIITTATDDLDIIYAHGTSNIILRDFLVRGFETGAMNDNGVRWDFVDNSKLINVWSEHNGDNGFELSNCDNDEVENCHGFSNNSDGIYISLSTFMKVSGCTGNENVFRGIYLESVSDCIFIAPIAHLNCTVALTQPGLYIRTSNRVVVVGALSDGNGTHGLAIFRSNYCSVTGGQFNNNPADGINIEGDVTANADYNIVTGVVCTGNGDDGIAVEGGIRTNKNIITSNQLLGNTGTPLVDNGTNTEVGHNITV